MFLKPRRSLGGTEASNGESSAFDREQAIKKAKLRWNHVLGAFKCNPIQYNSDRTKCNISRRRSRPEKENLLMSKSELHCSPHSNYGLKVASPNFNRAEAVKKGRQQWNHVLTSFKRSSGDLIQTPTDSESCTKRTNAENNEQFSSDIVSPTTLDRDELTGRKQPSGNCSILKSQQNILSQKSGRYKVPRRRGHYVSLLLDSIKTAKADRTFDEFELQEGCLLGLKGTVKEKFVTYGVNIVKAFVENDSDYCLVVDKEFCAPTVLQNVSISKAAQLKCYLIKDCKFIVQPSNIFESK